MSSLAMTAPLLPPNATPLEFALEQAFVRATDLPVVHDTIYNAQTCPAHLLGWLAWAVSVDEWDSGWAEEVKRNTIKKAPMLHQRKGTMWSIAQALEPLATGTKVTEWWQLSPPAAPGSFVVDTSIAYTASGSSGAAISPEVLAQIERIVQATKPVSRTHTVRVSVGFNTGLRVGSAFSGLQVLRSQGDLQPLTVAASQSLVHASIATPTNLLTTNGALH